MGVRQTLSYGEISVGQELPSLEVELTPSVIVAGAIASRDYQDVHHDYEGARSRGTPNIFMNILTSNGWVGRFVSDWAGPNAMLRKVKIRLGAPNYPGDTMRMRGVVAAKCLENGLGLVEVEIVGSNGLGDHVMGTVELSLPLGN